MKIPRSGWDEAMKNSSRNHVSTSGQPPSKEQPCKKMSETDPTTRMSETCSNAPSLTPMNCLCNYVVCSSLAASACGLPCCCRRMKRMCSVRFCCGRRAGESMHLARCCPSCHGSQAGASTDLARISVRPVVVDQLVHAMDMARIFGTEVTCAPVGENDNNTCFCLYLAAVGRDRERPTTKPNGIVSRLRRARADHGLESGKPMCCAEVRIVEVTICET